jgi:hypothetical protein
MHYNSVFDLQFSGQLWLKSSIRTESQEINANSLNETTLENASEKQHLKSISNISLVQIF